MCAYFRVIDPVVNLRRDLSDYSFDCKGVDRMQETQLLYNEKVRVLDESSNKVYVEALEQPHGISGGYKGWMDNQSLLEEKYDKENNLFITSICTKIEGATPFFVSFGTSFYLVSEDSCGFVVQLPCGKQGYVRKEDCCDRSLINCSRKFLDFPYFWGGRSSYLEQIKECPTSVDCSGFTQLLYRVQGCTIPRNAKDQWRVCQRVSKERLSPGNLIFSSEKGGEESIDHVMLFLGEGQLIEATESVGKVREISLKDKISQYPETEFFYGTIIY